MKFSTSAVVTLMACLPAIASAHYYFPHLTVNGVKSPEFQYVRKSTQGYQPHFSGDDDFAILQSNDLRCNTGAQDNAATTGVAKINAGDTISFGTNLEAKIQHPGPIQVYMSKAPSGDVQSYDGSGDWFKISELGATFPLTGGAEDWAVYNKDTIDVTIPSEVPAGQYLVRIEHVALHRPSGTEFYFNCAQVEVTNSAAGQESTNTIALPGGYTKDDAGFSPNFSLYSRATSYPFPGPSVFGSASSTTPKRELPKLITRSRLFSL